MPFNIGDLISDWRGVWAHNVRRSLESNNEGSKKTKAVVISPPIPIGDGAASERDKYEFFARIKEYHDAGVPDPCSMEFTQDAASIDEAMAYAQMHTKFTTNPGQEVPAVGDTINVTINRARLFDDTWGWNLQKGNYDGIDSMPPIFEIIKQITAGAGTETCQSLTSLFEGQGLTTLGDPLPMRAIYRGLGVREMINETIENGKYSAELLGSVDTKYSTAGVILTDLVSDYNNLAKAFYEKFKTKLPLGQGYRPYEEQSQIYHNPAKVNAKGQKLGAVPGTSNHGWGVAFDWNTTDKNGVKGFNSETYKWMLANAPTYNFENPSWAVEGGSKEEPWHFRSTKASKIITNKVKPSRAMEPVASQEDPPSSGTTS